MTDRELLELAAKAAGIQGRYFWNIEDRGIELPDGRTWDALENDGDALRLAVMLNIGVKYERNAPPEYKLPRECAVAVTEDRQWFCEEGLDPYAATRRAIVRAAAEIGRASQTREEEK